MVQQFKPVSTFPRMVPFTLSSAYPSKPSSFRPLLSDYHGNQEGNLCEALLQWERNEYFIPEGKKKRKSQLTWAILGIFSAHSPLPAALMLVVQAKLCGGWGEGAP